MAEISIERGSHGEETFVKAVLDMYLVVAERGGRPVGSSHGRRRRGRHSRGSRWARARRRRHAALAAAAADAALHVDCLRSLLPHVGLGGGRSSVPRLGPVWRIQRSCEDHRFKCSSTAAGPERLLESEYHFFLNSSPPAPRAAGRTDGNINKKGAFFSRILVGKPQKGTNFL